MKITLALLLVSAFSSCVLGSDYATAILGDGPLGYWRLGEANGAVAHDASPNNRDGMYVGTVSLGQMGAISADSDTAAHFDGSSAYVNVGAHSVFNQLTNNFTVEAWTRGKGPIVATWPGDASGFGFAIPVDPGLGTDSPYDSVLRFTTFGIKDYDYPYDFLPGEWYHVAAVFDSSNDATLFINGEVVDHIEGDLPANTNSEPLHIGEGANGLFHFDGRLDEVAIYGRALDAAEIREHYLATTSTQGTIAEGFKIQPWVTNLGDIRGVTVSEGGTFGQYPYVYSRSQQAVLRVTAQESVEVFATGFESGIGRIVIDETGTFGGDMFVANIFDGAGPADIVFRVAANGQPSVFYQSANQDVDLLTKGLAFGTGPGFASDLFIIDAERDNLVRLAPNGTRSSFASGVTSGSWEDDMLFSEDGPLGNYAYLTDGIHDRVLRISPNGATSSFASVVGAISLALGEGVFGDFLYVGTLFGDVYRVDASGNVTPFISGFGKHSPEGNFRGIDIANNTMWLTSDTGTLYRVSLVPEPSTMALALLAFFYPLFGHSKLW